MKLVEILAKELEEWPPHAFVAVQDDDSDHTIWFLQSDHQELSFMSREWRCGSPFDILISRPSQLAHDHSTAIVTEADWKKEARSIPDQSAVGEIYNAQDVQHGPLQWRDRIAEIDSTSLALTTERADLVQKLASEGFALIGRINELLTDAMQAHEDMSDWRNWKAGDQLTTVLENSCNIQIGGIVTLRSIEDPEYDGSMPVSVFYGDEWNWPEAQDESGACVFKFHSRPSA